MPIPSRTRPGKTGLELSEITSHPFGLARPDVEDSGCQHKPVGRLQGWPERWQPRRSSQPQRAEAEILEELRGFTRILLADRVIRRPHAELTEAHPIELGRRVRPRGLPPSGGAGILEAELGYQALCRPNNQIAATISSSRSSG